MPQSPLTDLIHNNALLKTLTGPAAEAGVFIIDPSGSIVFCSPLAAEKLKVWAEDVIGQSIFTVLNLCDAGGTVLDPAHLPITKALAGKQQTTPFFCCTKIGETYEPWVLRTYPVLEADSSLTCVVVKIRKAKRDVTLESMKSTFVSFAAHQLKTPSSVVKGYLELLLRPKTNAQQIQHYARQAYQANEQLIARSRNLLNLARIEGGLIEPDVRTLDLHKLLEQRLATYKHWFTSNNIQLQFTNSLPASIAVQTDAVIVQEIIDVLLHNALKHSPNDSELQVIIEQAGDSVAVSIIDNGPGLGADNKQTSKQHVIVNADILQNHSSHGLGLRLAYQFAALIGVTITLENRLDAIGARATITLK